MSTEIAVVSTPAQQITTTPSRSLAERLFSKSHGTPAVDTKAFNDHVTARELADYEETTRRMEPQHIALAQKLMATYGGEQVRNAVAAAGIGSNVWVMDLAARIQMALDAKDAEIAALKARR